MLPRITPDETLDLLYQNYIASLRATHFSGEIRTDYAARLTVATDNSIYQIIPQAVIFPRNTQDISIILKLSQEAQFLSIKFSPRGGGTATNGQSLSAGIIIDCSKYMRDILEINLEKAWVRVQPGVILDQLNQHLKPLGVHFAPEISPSNRATLGGMINTDACGNGSKIIGRTSDHVVSLTCVRVDGKILETESDNEDLLKKQLTDLLVPHKDLIQEKFFKAPRTLCGYNLAKAYQEQLNLNYLLCGAEGTLGIISECKLKLSPLPKFKKLVVIKYRHFNDALHAKEITPSIKPLVIETIDEKLITIAKQDSIYFYIKDFIEEANSINLVEFVGNDLEEMDRHSEKFYCDRFLSREK
jgi:FAD/FMN-containing dehydrogenase